VTRSLPLVTSSEPGPVLVAAAKFPSSLPPRWDRRDGGGAGSSREYRAAAAADPRPSPQTDRPALPDRFTRPCEAEHSYGRAP
jgi:hypothetical protein